MEQNKLYGIFWNGDFDNYFLGHQFEEIFKSRIYAPYLENKKDAVVLDIGANIGIFSLYASKYAKQVYAIEPSQEHFDTLSRMILHNELKNVKPIKKAIYMKEELLDFYHNNNKTMYSLHQSVEDRSQPIERVEATTIEKLMQEEKIDHVDLLKIDIEGTEFEVLSHPSFQKIADKIDVVVGETHAWANRNPQQLVDALRGAGFIVETIPNDAQLFVARKGQTTGTKV